MPGTLEKTATLQEISNTPTESMILLRLMKMVPQLMMIIANVKEFQNLNHPLTPTSLRVNLIIMSHKLNPPMSSLLSLNPPMIMFLSLNLNPMLLPHLKFPNPNM